MTATLKFTVPGKPQPMQRPRVTRKGAYTPNQSASAMEAVGLFARSAMSRGNLSPFLTGPLRLQVTFEFKFPQSTSKKKRAKTGSFYHTKRPDTDNLTKLVKDALQKAGIIGDDSQICDEHCCKFYSMNDKPATHVVLERLAVE